MRAAKGETAYEFSSEVGQAIQLACLSPSFLPAPHALQQREHSWSAVLGIRYAAGFDEPSPGQQHARHVFMHVPVGVLMELP